MVFSARSNHSCCSRSLDRDFDLIISIGLLKPEPLYLKNCDRVCVPIIYATFESCPKEPYAVPGLAK